MSGERSGAASDTSALGAGCADAGLSAPLPKKTTGAIATAAASTLHADDRESSISAGARMRRTRSRRLPPVAATPSTGRPPRSSSSEASARA